jgi:hypothetical protein
MASEYKRLYKKAVKKGWVAPASGVFSDEAWMRYWSAMEEHEKDPSKGRPIPPHRSGGGIRLG